MDLSAEEIASGKLSAEHHTSAIRDLKVLGYTILGGVLSAEKIASLRSEFLGVLDQSIRRIGDNRGRQRQGGVPLPIEGAFADPLVLANPLALEVITALLGDDITCSYYSSDTAMPGSEYQPAHRDGNELFPGLPVTLPPYMYEINVPLVDFREDNGPVEVWPRTHLVSSLELVDKGGLLRPALEERASDIQRYAEQLRPEPVLMPAGSLLLRDPRMWHRGSPNRSSEPRPMLAIAYNRPWYRFNAVTLSRAVFDGWPLNLKELFRLACIDGALSREFA